MTELPDFGPADDVQPAFGQRLKELRLQAGLSQVELAGESLHPSYVSLLEAGKRRPTRAAVKDLARRLGVGTDELAGAKPLVDPTRLVLAEAALGTGHPADTVAILGEAFAGESRPDVSTQTGFRATLTYATALERTGRLEEATAYYETLRMAAEESPAKHAWLPVVMALVRCYRDAGDLGRAVDLGEAAVARCLDLGQQGLEGYAALTSTLAGVYAERGDYLRAKVLLDDLLLQVEGGDSPTDRAYAYWEAAINAADRGHAGEGVRLAERASALLSESDDERSRTRIQVTRAWLLLADDPPDPTQARRLLRAALPDLRQRAGQLSVASAETELARSEILLGRYEVAVRLAKSALKRLHPEHRLERARALVALGTALVRAGEESAGLLELAGAAEALDEVGSNRQAAPVWRQLGELYRSVGDPERALIAADRALDSMGVTGQAWPTTPKPAASPASSRARSRQRSPSA